MLTLTNYILVLVLVQLIGNWEVQSALIPSQMHLENSAQYCVTCTTPCNPSRVASPPFCHLACSVTDCAVSRVA
jgi:hypothetical protein